MPSLAEIRDDPNYVNANAETKAAIFAKYSEVDDNYTKANPETQAAIRGKFGVGGGAPAAPVEKPPERTVIESAMHEVGNTMAEVGRGFATGGVPGAMVAGGKVALDTIGKVSSAVGRMAGEPAQEAATKMGAPAEVAGAIGAAADTAAQFALPGAANVARKAVGQAAKVIGSKVAPILEKRAADKAITAADQAAHGELVKAARSDGFVLTPRQANPASATANVVEGAAGSAKFEKVASIKNQKTANKWVGEDLDLKTGQRITEGAVDNYIKKQGAAYQAVKESGVVLKATPEYDAQIAKLDDKLDALPGIADSPEIDKLKKALSVGEMTAKEAIDSVKVLRSRAKANLKAGFIDPEKANLGLAQRAAANAIDDLIETNLTAAGKGELSSAYRAARVKIARAHNIDAALNETTGNVDSLYLAKLLEKDIPLSGGVEKVARFARSFSGSSRNVDKMKDATNFSAADLVVGGAGHLATGNVLGTAAMAARPAVRAILTSKLGQNAFGPSGRGLQKSAMEP